MAKYLRKDIVKMCGISQAYISVCIKRGALILNKNKEIDTEQPINQEFIDKRMLSKKQKENPSTESPPEKQPAMGKGSLVVVSPSVSSDENEIILKKKYGIDLEIKDIELKKKKQEVELKSIQLDKAKGKVIPTDLVKDVMSQQFKSVTIAFHQGADNFILKISKRVDLSADDRASLRNELIDIINESSSNAMKEGKKMIKSIVEDYSEKGREK